MPSTQHVRLRHRLNINREPNHKTDRGARGLLARALARGLLARRAQTDSHTRSRSANLARGGI
eukprot:2617277-Prymnesium_polylepis.1